MYVLLGPALYLLRSCLGPALTIYTPTDTVRHSLSSKKHSDILCKKLLKLLSVFLNLQTPFLQLGVVYPWSMFQETPVFVSTSFRL
ncbi:hypothetical protein NQ317_013268 [Molorchus minor]|uniref:Secreted protein n=1 Tax=Molorchus minor TaxID=1323400 RepID=A0ABQ9K0E6_9CUCU|nr:hypothetical protein NQ317_013268 [Molorchus minor]